MILCSALALRIYGLGFGLPDSYHADEPIVVNHAIAYGSGDLNPHFFKIPPLASYLLFGIYGVYYLLGHLVHLFQNTDSFLNFFLSDPSFFYWLGRIFLGVVPGTLTVYVFFCLMDQYFSRKHAWICSCFLATCFLHVRDSHYIYADIPLLLILLTAFFPMFKILSYSNRRSYILYGILAGTAIAMKYNGIFIFIPFFMVHFFGRKKTKSHFFNQDLFIAVAFSAFAYFLFNPFSLIDFKFFLNELLGQSHSEGFLGLWHHTAYSLNEGITLPLLIMASVGIALSLSQREQKRMVLLSFVAIYYLILAFFSQPYDRYVLPLIPFILFFAVDALIAIGAKFRLKSATLLVLCSILISFPLAKSIFSNYLFGKADVRQVALEWIETNISEDSKIALDEPFFLPRLKPNSKQLLEKVQSLSNGGHFNHAQVKRIESMIKQAEQHKMPRYELFFMKEDYSKVQFLFARPSIPFQLTELKNLGIKYVLIAQLKPGRNSEFLDNLSKEAVLLKEFNPYWDKKRQWPIDAQPLTGGPFLWSELLARERNGQIIKLFEIK